MQLRNHPSVRDWWPPDWGGALGRGEVLERGEDGILISVRLLNDHVSFEANFGGKTVSGTIPFP